jgi:hypothetical protein
VFLTWLVSSEISQSKIFILFFNGKIFFLIINAVKKVIAMGFLFWRTKKENARA